VIYFTSILEFYPFSPYQGKQKMSDNLTGKVALVTGASSGIGEATALALVAAGAAVALAARRVDRLENLLQRISDQGGEAMIIATDVSDEPQARDMVHQAHAKWGHIDILVNSAGIMQLGLIDGANTAEWRNMININFLGLMYATHAALPIMKAQGGGHIINISSTAGLEPNVITAVYSATKFAVGAFTEVLRKENHSHKVRVTLIEPGAVATELGAQITDPNAKAWAEEWLQSKTPLASEDIAAAIIYAVTQPQHVNVNEIVVRPIDQP
jgi:NADP-dependent 3-hydroxy acid dehydrogenase YdfG